MNRCRSLLSRFTSCRSFGAIGLAVVLCAMTAIGSGTGGKDSPTPQFTLRAVPVSAVHPAWQAPRIRNADSTSSNWSGYAVLPIAKTSSGKGKKSTSIPTFNGVTGSWVVPDVAASASANTYSSTWVGLDGDETSTVEQIGTDQNWSAGSPEYFAWFEMYPKWPYEIVGFPVNPGDRITASVEYGTKGVFTLTIINLDVPDGNGNSTTTFSITQRSSSAQRLSAEWIEEAPWSGGVLPLADFGVVDFFDCYATMNEHTGTINDPAWTIDEITMEDSDGPTKAQPSDLSKDGADFSVTWLHE